MTTDAHAQRDDSERKLIINLTYKCNNHCIFCSIADRAITHGDPEFYKERITAAHARGVRLLDLDGGEPTLYPHLFDILDFAVSIGMERITLTSNGRMFSDAAFTRRLAAYPIDLLISLHAADERLSEALTTQPRSFKQTLRGIVEAKKRFASLGVNTTLVTANIDQLQPLGALLAKIGIKTWNLQYYTPFGDVSPQLAPDPYHTGKVLAGLIDSFAQAMTLNIINLPFCFMPDGYADYCLKDVGKEVRHMVFVDGREVNLAEFLGEGRFKNGKCARCQYDSVCRGFWDYGNDPQSGKPYRIRMLDMIPGYPCSAKCRFCAVEDHLLEQAMDTHTAKAEMDRAMAFGPQIVRIGGGEPTDRDDLPELLSHAKSLEIPVRSIQTHGFRLADADYLNSLVRAGLTKVNISVRGATAAVHNDLTGAPGSFEKVVAAIKNVAARPELILELDAILTKQTIVSLAGDLAAYAGWGAKHVNLWNASAEGRARDAAKDLVPNLAQAAESVKVAAKRAPGLGIEQLRCYYIPYCFLKDFEEIVWHPLEENATVVTPGSRFTLDKGTLDLGVKVTECGTCAIRERCFGVPPSYVTHIGDPQVRPYSEIPPKLRKASN